MRSSGFGLGKKQNRSEQPKLSHRPTNTDLTQLLATSQKNPEKQFTLSWTAPNAENFHYSLSVISLGAGRDRRGWSSSAIDNAALADADWKLYQEIDGKRTEIFSMKCSDALLIQTLLDEALMTSQEPSLTGGSLAANEELESLRIPQTQGESLETASFAQSPPYSMAPEEPEQRRSAPMSPEAPLPKGSVDAPFQEGNLRTMGIRKLMETYNANKTTGRLMCDIGTVQAEVFFMAGEPVHAKSCHSIYADKDKSGDEVIVDLLTWKEGNFKLQEGWPAASRSVTSTLSMFLSGQVSAPAPAPATSSPNSAAAKPHQDPGAFSFNPGAPSVAPGTLASNSGAAVLGPDIGHAGLAGVDDFSNVDELIEKVYTGLLEPSGLLKYGMFLMLVRCEFVRFEKARNSFCVASIELKLPDRAISEEILGNIGGCFEGACGPLDIVAAADLSHLYALFPQSDAAMAGRTLKHFTNNIASAKLDGNLHGSSMNVSIGLAEVPRDGVEFEQVFAHACKLRRSATPERRVVTSTV